MTAARKWSDAQLLRALETALRSERPSQTFVAHLLDGSPGAIRKRCRRDPLLWRLWRAVRA